jgi:hypothetical protein
LGSAANIDLQNSLDENWFAIGMKLNNESRALSADKIVRIESTRMSPPADPIPTLELTYIP